LRLKDRVRIDHYPDGTHAGAGQVIAADTVEAPHVVHLVQIYQKQCLQADLTLLNKGEYKNVVSYFYVIRGVTCHPSAVFSLRAVGIEEVGVVDMLDLYHIGAILPLHRLAHQVSSETVHLSSLVLAVQLAEDELSANVYIGILRSDMCIAHRGKTGFHIGHKGYLTGELKAGYEVVQEIYLTVQSFDIAETCLGLPAVFGESKLIPGDDIKAEYSSLSPKNKLLSVQVRSIRRSVETRQRGFTVLLRILARRDNCFDFLLAYIKVPLSIPSFFCFP